MVFNSCLYTYTGGKTGTYFNGNRYIKDNDPGAMVLMDKNGYIAGIQAGVSSTSYFLNDLYCTFHMRQPPTLRCSYNHVPFVCFI